jgi:hypothetical protein
MSPWAYKVEFEGHSPGLFLSDADAEVYENIDEGTVSIISWDSSDENGGDA